MSSPEIPSLEGLTNLARRSGVDIRPTLVRVLTDLYVQQAVHTLEEEQHYTELVLRLIEGVDLATRAIVARKLANYPAAPQKVVERLARDMPEVAEPILRHSPRLSSVELLSMIAEFGPRYAAAIAARQPVGDAAEPAGEENTAGSLSEKAPLPASAPTPAPAPDAPSVPEHEMRIGDLFFAATRAQRRLILVKLAEFAPGPDTASTAAPEAIRRLEAAALERRPEAFMRELEGALGISEELARRIVLDPSGEPLMVALRTLGLRSAVVARILLFLDPKIGQSVERVFDLAGLYDQLAPHAAMRLMTSLRELGLDRRRTPGYQPVHWTEPSERISRLSTDAARRQIGPPAPDLRRDPRRHKIT
ncbi:MAG TPA: hypothetical protein VEK55_01865 [Xanthobacteraceae bacterium]|nr:hypothetical protein [Xanthobacteraceae bacterium]